MDKKFDLKEKISFNWAATIGLILATLIIAFFATGYKLPQVHKYEKDLAGRNNDELTAQFLAKSVIDKEDDSPYLETGIVGLYYCVDGDKITYHRVSDNGEFKKVRVTDTVKLQVPAKDKTEEVTVYFTEYNEETIGFGVLQNKKSKDFPYAFIKVIPNRVTENYDYLAFVDFTIGDFYKNTKTYDAAYAFLANDSKLEEIFVLDPNTSFVAVDLIKDRADGFYYFTKNEGDAEGYSLFMKTTTSSKEVIVSGNIALPYGFCKDGDLLLLEYAKSFKDAEGVTLKGDTIFCLSKVTGIMTEAVYEFNRDPATYLVKGYYILNPDAKILYDVLGGAEQVIDTTLSFDGVEDFAISDGGSKIALAGSIGTESDRLFFFEFATDRMQVISGKNLFLLGNPNVSFTSLDYVSFLSPSTTADTVKNIVVPWEQVF